MSVSISNSDIERLLDTPLVPGKHPVSSFVSFASARHLPFSMIEDVAPMDRPEAEVHRYAGDLWYCLLGSATFVCGGELVDGQARKNADGSVNEGEWFGNDIRGGREQEFRVGDWLWIPAGEPHQHWSATSARMLVIKILQNSIGAAS